MVSRVATQMVALRRTVVEFITLPRSYMRRLEEADGKSVFGIPRRSIATLPTRTRTSVNNGEAEINRDTRARSIPKRNPRSR